MILLKYAVCKSLKESTKQRYCFTELLLSFDCRRSRLARELLCEHEKSRNVQSGLCEAQARKILPHLAAALDIELTQAQSKPPQSGKLM